MLHHRGITATTVITKLLSYGEGRGGGNQGRRGEGGTSEGREKNAGRWINTLPESVVTFNQKWAAPSTWLNGEGKAGKENGKVGGRESREGRREGNSHQHHAVNGISSPHLQDVTPPFPLHPYLSLSLFLYLSVSPCNHPPRSLHLLLHILVHTHIHIHTYICIHPRCIKHLRIV